MATAEQHPQQLRSWKHLSPEEAQHRLGALHLFLDQRARALICIRCKYALKPSGETVSKHLWEKHQTPPEARYGLSAYVKTLCLTDPNDLPLRHDDSEPHPHLSIISGAECRRCEYRSASVKLVARHLSKVHDVRKGNNNWLRDEIRENVNLQSWTQNGCRKYWSVHSGPSSVLPASPDSSPRRRRRVNALHEQEEKRLACRDSNVAYDDTGIDDLASTSNWMHRTSWAKTYQGVDRRLLLKLREAPEAGGQKLLLGRYGREEVYSSGDQEKHLFALGKAIDRFFDRCEDTARHTDHSVRCWLRGQIVGRPYKAPFNLPERKKTTTKYRGIWKSMIFFYMRLLSLDVRLRRDFLHIELSESQIKACQLLCAAPEPRAGDTNTPAHDTSSPYDENVMEDATRVSQDKVLDLPWRKLPLQPLRLDSESEEESPVDAHTAVDFSYDELSDASSEEIRDEMGNLADAETDSLYAAPTYGDEVTIDRCFSPEDLPAFSPLGVPSLQDDGNTSITYDLDDKIAEFSYYLCTEEFEDGLPSSTAIVYFSGILGFTLDGSTFERPSRYTPKLSAIIFCIRLCMLERILPRFPHPKIGWPARPRLGGLKRFAKFRDRFLCYGCQSPTGELLGLRAYGRALSRADGPIFRVHWDKSAQTVGWDGGTLSMDQLRRLGRLALAEAQSSMKRLLYGYNPGLMPDQLHDKMSNQRQGYSFVTEPENDLERAYLELSSKACLHPVDGLMSSDVWKIDAVHRYFKEETKLLRHIMLMMYLRGGQAPRTTEFLSIECYNGPSTSRGIYIHNGAIVYVTRHSKARRMTNQEFQVARYLPRKDSELVATYLAIVRPFTDMLNRACLGYDRERRLMFASADNVDKHWQSDVLTKALKDLTQQICLQPFGVQVYRQLSIAITERHVKDVSQPFNLYDDKTMAADIEVVFAWQSGHRPMQRGTSYGIDAAYPDSLQPALLRVYRWVSHRWHEFLRTDERPLLNPDMTASESNSGTKRVISDGSEGDPVKRFRMSDVNQDITFMPTLKRGFLVSALQRRADNHYHA